MTRSESLAILGLKDDADMAEIKRAYRKLAFALHPDLNPDEHDAARRFQRLNEAYVELSKAESKRASMFFSRGNGDARAREEASKAYSKARQGQDFSHSGAKADTTAKTSKKEEVLKDILQDPFARRVFEDIYSHIQDGKAAREKPGTSKVTQHPSAQRRVVRRHQSLSKEVPTVVGSMVGKLKGWLRRQIDDEQVIRLPGTSLIPGARVRLEIQHGLSGEPEVVELTLPPEFAPGKAMRLKGMGKRLGKMRGDLYVRIMAE